ncbi:MAG: GNAT family N-acetyltransferase [Paracoccaceae bacterium]|jgi:hypothetical protein|nr:GNAT family N-acetyltransferase [Paracoccaceae bacterium]
MPLKSLGFSSDVLVMQGLSEFVEHGNYFTLRTRSEPDFWFGNMIIFKDDHVDLDTQFDLFKKEFPEVGHITIGWDIPNMDQAGRFDDFKDRGLELELDDILTLQRPLVRALPPEGIELRQLKSDDDFEQATLLQIATGLEEGRSGDLYTSFARGRMTNRRKQIQDGWATWFGAFDGAELVGDLGIYADDRTARFQSIETRASHRRRGICASLVTAGVDWAANRSPSATPVIAAEPDGDAGRIYRRCGFDVSERLIAVFRGPLGA